MERKISCMWAVLGILMGTLLAVLLCSAHVSAEEGLTWQKLESDIQTMTKGDLNWSDSVWMEIGNMGMQLVGSWADCSVDTISIDIAANTAEYSLPVSFSKLWAVVNQADYTVYERMSLSDRGLAGTGTDDDVYKVYTYTSSRGKVGKSLGIYPIPSTADSALVYFFKTPDIVDAVADTVDIVEPYHPAVMTACLIYVHERLGGKTHKDEANRLWALLPVQLNNAKARLEAMPPDIIISPRMSGREGQ